MYSIRIFSTVLLFSSGEGSRTKTPKGEIISLFSSTKFSIASFAFNPILFYHPPIPYGRSKSNENPERINNFSLLIKFSIVSFVSNQNFSTVFRFRSGGGRRTQIHERGNKLYSSHHLIVQSQFLYSIRFFSIILRFRSGEGSQNTNPCRYEQFLSSRQVKHEIASFVFRQNLLGPNQIPFERSQNTNPCRYEQFLSSI